MRAGERGREKESIKQSSWRVRKGTYKRMSDGWEVLSSYNLWSRICGQISKQPAMEKADGRFQPGLEFSQLGCKMEWKARQSKMFIKE